MCARDLGSHLRPPLRGASPRERTWNPARCPRSPGSEGSEAWRRRVPVTGFVCSWCLRFEHLLFSRRKWGGGLWRQPRTELHPPPTPREGEEKAGGLGGASAPRCGVFRAAGHECGAGGVRLSDGGDRNHREGSASPAKPVEPTLPHPSV